MRSIRLALPLVFAAGFSACATTNPEPLMMPPEAAVVPANPRLRRVRGPRAGNGG